MEASRTQALHELINVVFKIQQTVSLILTKNRWSINDLLYNSLSMIFDLIFSRAKMETVWRKPNSNNFTRFNLSKWIEACQVWCLNVQRLEA